MPDLLAAEPTIRYGARRPARGPKKPAIPRTTQGIKATASEETTQTGNETSTETPAETDPNNTETGTETPTENNTTTDENPESTPDPSVNPETSTSFELYLPLLQR